MDALFHALSECQTITFFSTCMGTLPNRAGDVLQQDAGARHFTRVAFHGRTQRAAAMSSNRLRRAHSLVAAAHTSACVSGDGCVFVWRGGERASLANSESALAQVLFAGGGASLSASVSRTAHRSPSASPQVRSSPEHARNRGSPVNSSAPPSFALTGSPRLVPFSAAAAPVSPVPQSTFARVRPASPLDSTLQLGTARLNSSGLVSAPSRTQSKGGGSADTTSSTSNGSGGIVAQRVRGLAHAHISRVSLGNTHAVAVTGAYIRTANNKSSFSCIFFMRVFVSCFAWNR